MTRKISEYPVGSFVVTAKCGDLVQIVDAPIGKRSTYAATVFNGPIKPFQNHTKAWPFISSHTAHFGLQ